MRVPYYQVNAFTTRPFGGNPAGVVFLAGWLPDALLQQIAAENNLSETAFLVLRAEGEWDLRWFTPTVEVDLCGHATLAPADVLFTERGFAGGVIRFHTRSGVLAATRDEAGRVVLDFPSWKPQATAWPAELVGALGAMPTEIYATRDLLAVFAEETTVRTLQPDFARLAGLEIPAVICTAPGSDCDFVSRFFAPSLGVPEDPVTGSAHSTLTPFWSARLGRTKLQARQISARGGELWCEDRGDRVSIAGFAALYQIGELVIPEL